MQKVKFDLEDSNDLAKKYQVVFNMSKCSWHFCVSCKNRGFTFKASYCEAKVRENWVINWMALPGCLIDFLLLLHKILTNFIQNVHSRCSELTHIYWYSEVSLFIPSDQGFRKSVMSEEITIIVIVAFYITIQFISNLQKLYN